MFDRYFNVWSRYIKPGRNKKKTEILAPQRFLLNNDGWIFGIIKLNCESWFWELQNVNSTKNLLLSEVCQIFLTLLNLENFLFKLLNLENMVSTKSLWKLTKHKTLTLLWRRPLSYRNQSIDLQSKWVDWFLYDNGLRHERVKEH